MSYFLFDKSGLARDGSFTHNQHYLTHINTTLHNPA